ncbi:MAG: hypothetical protein WC511_06385 [Candidatus Pacearchaeota archaeon]|jgi:hypothetical protein
MIETNKGTSLVIMILSVMVLVIISLFVYQEFFAVTGNKQNINFIEEGNLVFNNPGLVENVWYLVYDTEGAAANNVKLIFDEKSICRNQTSCSDLMIGQQVEIRGVRNDGEVLVKELKLTEILN